MSEPHKQQRKQLLIQTMIISAAARYTNNHLRLPEQLTTTVEKGTRACGGLRWGPLLLTEACALGAHQPQGSPAYCCFSASSSFLMKLKRKQNTFIYLAALGLSSGTWDLQFSMWHAGHSVATCGIQFPDQG